MRVKVCGLTRKEDVDICCEMGISALGFILAESPRRVCVKDVELLTKDIPPFISRVAVVMNPEHQLLKEISESKLFDYIQFHGEEEPELIREYPLLTIKSISIGASTPIKRIKEQINKYKYADFYLFDSKVGKIKGGTGKSFNWGIFSLLDIDKPFILAGGLDPYNIKTALINVKMAGVDLNSGLESSPGIKDKNLLINMVNIINNFSAEKKTGE